MISKYYDSVAALQVIGCCMRKPEYLAADGQYFFSEHDFCNDLHKVVFGALYSLYNAGVTDHLAREIENYLKDKPKAYAVYKANKGREWMFETHANAHLDAFEYYYNRLKKMSLLRAYDDVGVDVSDIYDPDNILDSAKKQAQDEYLDSTTLEQLADDVEGKFYFIRDLYVDNNDNDSVAIGDNVQKIVDELAQHPARGWAMYDLYEDAIAMGARPGRFYLRSAATGVGKSRTGVADACFFSCSEYYSDEGKWERLYNRVPTLYISVELDIEELTTMALAFIGNIPEDHIVEMDLLTFEEEERLKKAVQILEEAPLRMEYLPNYGMKDVENCIKRNMRKYKYPRVDEQGNTDYLTFQCVVFDYLTSSIKMIEEISHGTGMKVREDQILFLMSSKLKEIAVENNIFLLSSTQINGSYRQEKILDQNMLAGAKSIANRIDYGEIMVDCTDEDIQDIEGVLAQHPGMCPPNVKRSVYKNRRGKFNRVICWMRANKGTCRYKTLFVTDFSFKPIDKDEIFQKKKE